MDETQLLIGAIKGTKYTTKRWSDLGSVEVTGPRGGWTWAHVCPGTARLVFLWMRRPSPALLLAPAGDSSFRVIAEPEARVRTAAARSRPDITTLISELDAAEDDAAIALLMQIVGAFSMQSAPADAAIRDVIDQVLSCGSRHHRPGERE